MTAEIVIINQHGVAMAADSAVTIGSQKIINRDYEGRALSYYLSLYLAQVLYSSVVTLSLIHI